MTTITEQITLAVINCGECGGTYAINERYRRQKEELSGTWTCPYCRCGWGYCEGKIAKLQKELSAAKCETLRQQQLRESAERERAIAQAEIARQKKRSSAGVCSCCNRSFANLRRHMATKHGTTK